MRRKYLQDVKGEELPLPFTFPETGNAFQMIAVVEDMNDDCRIHVELADVMDYAESWGVYLAEVARVIARDCDLATERSDGDVFATMCDGFKRRAAE